MNEDIERRADVKTIIVTDPNTGRKVTRKAPRREIEIGKGKMESKEVQELSTDLKKRYISKAQKQVSDKEHMRDYLNKSMDKKPGSFSKSDKDFVNKKYDKETNKRRKGIRQAAAKMESSDAYAKALDRVKYRKQMSGISSSDKDKLGKVADMMSKERMRKKIAQQANEAYSFHAEPGKNGGYRAHMKNPEGKTSYLGSAHYKSKKHAEGEAKAYHDRYFGTPGMKANDRGAENAVHDYRKKNKEHMHETTVMGGSTEKKSLYKVKKDMNKAVDSANAKMKARDDYKKKYAGVQGEEVVSEKSAAEVLKKRYASYHPDDNPQATKRVKSDDGSGMKTYKMHPHAKLTDRGYSKKGKMAALKKQHERRPEKYGITREAKKNCGCGQDPCITYGTKGKDMDVKEYITGKQIRMAKGIAFDKRHKGGDYTGAAKKMEKIKKGLSNHPAVKKALRTANETRLMSMQEVAGSRGRPKRGEDAASDSHIIMQLRSAQDLRGNKDIKFRGNRSAKVHPKHIDKILKYHDHPSLKPIDKRKLRVAISKSHDHLKRVANAIKV